MLFPLLLSLLTPTVLVVASIAQRHHTKARQREQGRCFTHIAHLLRRDEMPDNDNIKRLLRHHTASTVCATLNYSLRTLRGGATGRIVAIGRACNLHINPIVLNPDHAIRHIADIQRRLSLCEVAHISSSLLANGCPIAYTPLLTSHNHNLQLIGLYLVYHFGFVDAEPLVRRILNANEPSISHLAMHTLCSISGNMHAQSVTSHFEQLSPPHRKELLRHAVQSCYSHRGISRLFNEEECREFAARISSYKCTIPC